MHGYRQVILVNCYQKQYIQLYYATGAAKDKKEHTINTKSNEKKTNKHLQSTQIVNIHQENLWLTHTQVTVNFGKS